MVIYFQTAAYNALFSNLWYSTLPCFDVQNITADRDLERSVLKYCEWKGLKISCAAIFTTYPTDKGMCCAFNMKSAEEIFQGKTYPSLVNKLQKADKKAAFSDSQVCKCSAYLQSCESFFGLTLENSMMIPEKRSNLKISKPQNFNTSNANFQVYTHV